jgi:Putative Ig domain
VTATTLGGAAPVLSLSKTDNTAAGTVDAGGTLAYSLVAGVATGSPASELDPTTIEITDPLPAGETTTAEPSGTGWNCAASTSTDVSCTNTATAALAAGKGLPPITVPVRVPASASGQVTNTAEVASDDAATVSASDSVTVLSPPVLTADTPPATAPLGHAYSYQFAASGDPASTFTVSSGGLPPGLTLNGGTGILSGTPTTAGSSTFTIEAANGIAPDAVSGQITIKVPVVPTCKVTALIKGPPTQQQVTVQDTGSGLKSITNIKITNGTVATPSFTQGTTGPVVVTATKTNQSAKTVWSFDATDMAGNLTDCS